MFSERREQKKKKGQRSKLSVNAWLAVRDQGAAEAAQLRRERARSVCALRVTQRTSAAAAAEAELAGRSSMQLPTKGETGDEGAVIAEGKVRRYWGCVK